MPAALRLLLTACKPSSIILSCSLNSSFNCFAVHFDIRRAILHAASANDYVPVHINLDKAVPAAPGLSFDISIFAHIFHIYFVCDGLFMSFRRTLNGRLIAIGFPEPPA